MTFGISQFPFTIFLACSGANVDRAGFYFAKGIVGYAF
jgi:hypothetical protein